MFYQTLCLALAAAAIVLTVVHLPVWHCQYQSYRSWQETGFDADSDALTSYKRYHNVETWIAMGMISCLCASYFLAVLIGYHLITAQLPHPEVLRYSVWTAAACFFIGLTTNTTYRRLIDRGCASCACRRTTG